MTAMRAPVVAGVGGGVGTTTVAVALRGHDAGRVAERWPDILVCRGTLDSLRRAAAVLETADPDAFPVLAVTVDAARAARRPFQARLEQLEPDFGALVLLPYVRRWATLADPLAEAVHLLAEPPERLPRPLRTYAAALRELVEAVTVSGRLDATPDERHTGHSGSGDRHSRHVGSEPHAQRNGSDGRNGRRTGRDQRALHREYSATHREGAATHRERGVSVERPGLTPASTAAPQRRSGVQIVRPDRLPTTGVLQRHAPTVGAAGERTDQAERTDRVERDRIRPTEQAEQVRRTERVG